MSAGPVHAGFDEGVTAYEREDYATALREFLPAAQNGDGIAQSYVGVIYQYGLGVVADLEKAVYWYAQAADNGDTMAQRILGDLHAEGAWGKRDFTAAARWYELAAEAGDVDAQRKLGNLCLEGRGIKRDHNLAAKWLQQAAGQDDLQAREALRNTYVDRTAQKTGRSRANGRVETALRAPSRCAGASQTLPTTSTSKSNFQNPESTTRATLLNLARFQD